jgi:hypothetical protein
MVPRVCEVEHRDQTNEPLNPGSFASTLLCSIQGIIVRVTSRGLWLPDASVSVPVGPGSLSLSHSLDGHYSPIVSVHADLPTRWCSLEGGFQASDFFRKGMMEVAAGSMFRSARFGGYFSNQFFDETWLLRLAWDQALRRGSRVGALVAFDQVGLSSIVASVQRTFGKTTAAAIYKWKPRGLQSQVTLGFHREFLTSSLIASLTGTGVLTSVYSRQLTHNVALGLVASAALRQKSHTIGIRLTIQQFSL